MESWVRKSYFVSKSCTSLICKNPYVPLHLFIVLQDLYHIYISGNEALYSTYFAVFLMKSISKGNEIDGQIVSFGTLSFKICQLIK